MKKYRVTYRTEIEVIECERETSKFVWIRFGKFGSLRQTAKHSTYDCYFDTWEDARAHIITKASRASQAAERGAQRRSDELFKANNIPKHEPADE